MTNAKTIDKSYPFESILYLDTGSITEGKIESFQKIDVKDAPSRAKRLVKANDIVYSTVRPIQRHYGILKNPQPNLVVSTGFTVIEVNQNLAHPDFIYHLLSADESVEFLDVIAEASTSTYPSLKPSDIENLNISLPKLEEQKAIASVLNSLDDKIDLLHRQNTTLEAMAETLFRQWFVEEAQEDWEQGSLGDISDNVRNSVQAKNIEADTKYIGLEHIDRHNIALKQYGVGADVNSNKYTFEKNDILFGKLRPYFHKVCFSPFSGICSTDILVIRPKSPDYFAFCLFAFFQNDVVEYANLGSGGTRMPRTDWDTLKKFPISLPDKNTIIKFNDIVLPSINRIAANLEQLETLEKLRDNLLPKMMSGEVRITY